MHRTKEELHNGIEHIQQSPTDRGTVDGITIRPVVDKRISLEECELSPEVGLHGDRWAQDFAEADPFDPRTQVALMNTRVIGLLSPDRERWPLAGDNLFVDFDLSNENLPTGQRLAIGSVILEITEVPHNGCGKFMERFGADAAKFVNTHEFRHLNLRGIYAKVVQAGTIRCGDVITKLD